VTEDERRHTRYCATIGKRYAGSDDAWEALVAEARVLETEAFVEAGVANVDYCAEAGLLGGSAG